MKRDKKQITKSSLCDSDIITKPKKQKIAIATDSFFALHKGPKSHPERPRRILTILKKLNSFLTQIPSCHFLRSSPISQLSASLIHPISHFDKVASLPTLDSLFHSSNSIYESGDMFWNKYTSKCALLAAGTVKTAVTAVLEGHYSSAFALVRPPGHHAGPTQAEGFCWLNNVAIAARSALQKDSCKKVLILDWDVHHGNGTQEAFWEDNEVLFISLHRLAWGFYPGTGRSSELGGEGGKGFTVNIPWRKKYLGDDEYRAAFKTIIRPIAEQFGPDLVIVSAGFDAAEGDLVGEMSLSPAGYGWMTREAKSFTPKGRIVLALEGGYCVEATADSVMACLDVLDGPEIKVENEFSPPNPLNLENKEETPLKTENWTVLKNCASSALETLREVCLTQKMHWNGLEEGLSAVETELEKRRGLKSLTAKALQCNLDEEEDGFFSGLGGLSGFMKSYHEEE